MEISFNNLWHCHTNGDIVLAAQRALKAAGLSEQILMHFCDLTLIWNFSAQAKITYILAWKNVVCLPREILSLLPKNFP